MRDWDRAETRRASRADQGAIVEQAVWAAMADQGTREAMVDQGTQEVMADLGGHGGSGELMPPHPKKKLLGETRYLNGRSRGADSGGCSRRVGT